MLERFPPLLARSPSSGAIFEILASSRKIGPHPVPLEYSVESLTCAFASRLDVVLVSP